MELNIYAEGPGFRENSDLKSILDLLNGYEVTFSYCLKKSSITHDVVAGAPHPKLKLTTVEPGSINISLVTDIAASIAPLAPSIFGYAWQLYKSAYDLIIIATRYFKNTGRPMTININNSPGTVVNVVNGDQVTTSRDVFDAAVSIHPFLDKIAKLVKTRKADRVVMRANRPDLQQQVQFDRTNQDSFQLPSANIIEEDPVEFECNIYRFNKKSLKGVLEFYDEDEVQIRPFMTGRDLLDDCMEAFKAPRANFIAHKEVTTNALGETKIKKFHLVAITPTGESDE